MIDVLQIKKYKENNRIEAKKAMGGLPKSIWETYSAFANTLGGVILLGVEEYKDKSLHPVNLPDPEGMVEEFWRIVNHTDKVSVNILSAAHVRIETVEGNRIIVITVPRAERYNRPVYIDKDPFSGAYRRNGEGDYRCTPEEIEAMLRDAVTEEQDARILEAMLPEAFDGETVDRYRDLMEKERPDHPWETLMDLEFLHELGALGRGTDGRLHPTVAGLLMFGRVEEITKEFPAYVLDYEEYIGEAGHLTERRVSLAGDWSGNVFDFYLYVQQRLARDLFSGTREFCGATGEEARHAVAVALEETLQNCLVNADYCGVGGVVIVKSKEQISVSNPGGFRIDLTDAKDGGISDPRNGVLARMFRTVNVGEGSGNGIAKMFRTKNGKRVLIPKITESFAPERITVTFDFPESRRRRVHKKAGDRVKAVKVSGRSLVVKQMTKERIIEYLTYHISAAGPELAAVLTVKPHHIRQCLKELTAEGLVMVEESEAGKQYKLKA